MRKVIIPIVLIVAVIFTSTVTCFATFDGSTSKKNGFGKLYRQFSETISSRNISNDDMMEVTVVGTTSVRFVSSFTNPYKCNWKTLSNITDTITFSHYETDQKPLLFSTISDYISRTTTPVNNTTKESTVTLTFNDKNMYNYYEKNIGEGCRAKDIYYIKQTSTCTASFYGATTLTLEAKSGRIVR